MPLFEGLVTRGNQIIIEVLINRGKGNLTLSETKVTFAAKALLDTGATHTCISKRIIKHFNLEPEGQKPVSTPTETVLINQYNINFHLPITGRQSYLNEAGKVVEGQVAVFSRNNLEVSELLNTPSSYDVLVGMDVISEMSLSIFRRKYYLSF